MESTESQEMYLLSIYRLQKKLPLVREADIAMEINYSRPSTHKALKMLAEKGWVNFVRGNITLTQDGKDIAIDLEEKHHLILKALTILGLDEETAEANACRIEHVLSDEVYNVLRKHILAGEQRLMQKMMKGDK